MRSRARVRIFRSSGNPIKYTSSAERCQICLVNGADAPFPEARIRPGVARQFGFMSARQSDFLANKNRTFCRAVSFYKPGLLFAVAETPRPPSRAAGLGVGWRLGGGAGRSAGRA